MTTMSFTLVFSLWAFALAFCIGFSLEIHVFVKKLMCKAGRHDFKGKRYYCNRCKKPRKWPVLKSVAGDKKDITFPKV